MAAQAPATDNPLLDDWTGPYGGVPPFDRVRVEDLALALGAAIAENLEEVERIAAQDAPPSFENTVEAMERTGRALDRVVAIYGVWVSTLSTPEVRAVEREMAPRLAELSDRITQNAALFRRIEAVYEARDTLDAEQRRLAWLYHTSFTRAGARLDDDAKARLSAINRRLAELFTDFSQNVLGDETEHRLVLESEGDLAGLPQTIVDAAAVESGSWVIPNTRSAIEPFLVHSDRRDLRERAWRMWVGRGDGGDANDTKSIVREILALRSERARLLGYETHAHWRLEHAMAEEPARALELVEAVWPPAISRVREEVAEMAALARRQGEDERIEPWDYRYWAEKVRRERYAVDQSRVKPYLQLEKLREGMFWVAGELFGLEFRPVADVPVYHPDVRVWAVAERGSGRHVGLWYFDPYAREGKKSGAWMNAYRSQERFDGEVPTIVSNNANFVKGRPGEPLLISWDDAETLFHEFGHALHGLVSAVRYPSLSGTAVPRDYVEFPSQLLEHWLSTPEVLERFALHHETGEPIPPDLVERIEQAARFNQGFATLEYLASALVDLELHLAAQPPDDPAGFERETLDGRGMPPEVVARHRVPHFQHVFGSDGYSAGYYSYLWADVLTADAFEAFTQAGGAYDRDVADRLREHVFSAGNTVDPAEAYRRFRGRDPEVEALMRKRGFLPEG